jgi:hypothetical protein
MVLAQMGICRTRVVGAIGLLALLAQVGCGGGEPISSKTSRFEVADDSEPTNSTKEVESRDDNDPSPNTTQEKAKPRDSIADASSQPSSNQTAVRRRVKPGCTRRPRARHPFNWSSSGVFQRSR